MNNRLTLLFAANKTGDCRVNSLLNSRQTSHASNQKHEHDPKSEMNENKFHYLKQLWYGIIYNYITNIKFISYK